MSVALGEITGFFWTSSVPNWSRFTTTLVLVRFPILIFSPAINPSSGKNLSSGLLVSGCEFHRATQPVTALAACAILTPKCLDSNADRPSVPVLNDYLSLASVLSVSCAWVFDVSISDFASARRSLNFSPVSDASSETVSARTIPPLINSLAMGRRMDPTPDAMRSMADLLSLRRAERTAIGGRYYTALMSKYKLRIVQIWPIFGGINEDNQGAFSVGQEYQPRRAA